MESSLCWNRLKLQKKDFSIHTGNLSTVGRVSSESAIYGIKLFYELITTLNYLKGIKYEYHVQISSIIAFEMMPKRTSFRNRKYRV